MSLPIATDPNSMLTLGSLALASFPDSQASVVIKVGTEPSTNSHMISWHDKRWTQVMMYSHNHVIRTFTHWLKSTSSSRVNF